MSVERIESVSVSFFGKSAIEGLSEELKKKNARRALIVTDKFLFENGTVDKVGQALLKADVEYAVYYLVQPNPTVEVVDDCILAAKALAVDWLVAVGGGSSIDTAKAVSIVLTNGGRVEDYEGVNKSRLPGLPIAAVNTTAGTGSEVTTFYIVTDTKKHSKMCMNDVNCKVRIAINDIQFMMEMPKSLTAATGMDALTHAVEALMSKRANPLTDKDALWAITVIKNYLPKAVQCGQDEQARNMMAYAEYTAGMAFSNAGLGMVHAMAHALGGFYNLPHGVCNAVLLPFVMEFNGRKAAEIPFARLAHALEIPEADGTVKEENVKNSIAFIKALSRKLGIPGNLRELNTKTEDFKALAKLALKDACILDNCVMPSLEQIISAYERAYTG